MVRSMNSALDLKRGEYDFEVVYADTEPFIAEEISGCEVVSRDSSGSGC
jgi:hypothetical protein